MAKCVFDSCCGCIELHNGTKTLGIIMVILKLARLVEVGFLIFVSLLLHAIAGHLSALTETKFAMPVVSAVVIVLQLVFLIMFIVHLYQNHINNLDRLYIANAVCFAIECIAVAIFLVVLIWDKESNTEMKIGFVVGDIFATVLNLYFILLLRSCLARENGEAPPLPTKEKNGEEIITIPFLRL